MRDFNFSFPASVEEVVAANLYSQIGLFRRIQKKHMKIVYDALKAVGLRNAVKIDWKFIRRTAAASLSPGHWLITRYYFS